MLSPAPAEQLEAKPIPVVPQADDFIQPGTEGIWNGHNFSITGRFRIWFEGTVYNYWTLLLADGNIRLLGEGYGMFAIYEKLDYGNYLVSAELKTFTYKRPCPSFIMGMYRSAERIKAYATMWKAAFINPSAIQKSTLTKPKTRVYL